MRTIVHVDMDAFFAAVETLLHPEYAGKPLIVGGDPKGRRGVVSTCSYEARKYGVRSAMPIREAVRLCPHAIFVRPDMAKYAAASAEVFRTLETFTPLIEPVSIDEAFLDMTGCEHFHPSLVEMGRAIKERVKAATGLVASIGIGPNKFIAKLASDDGKPDGLVVVDADRVQEYLDPLPVRRLWGVGPKTAARLETAGIRTVRELRARSKPWLVRTFGEASGAHLFSLARGVDDRPVEPEHTRKSLSREITFDEDVDDPARLRHTLAGLVADVGARLREEGLWPQTVFLKLRYPDFTTLTRRAALGSPAQDDDRLYMEAERLLLPLLSGGPVRLLGVGVTDFARERQASLFEADERSEEISRLMDRVNAKFSGRVLQKGRERFVTGASFPKKRK